MYIPSIFIILFGDGITSVTEKMLLKAPPHLCGVAPCLPIIGQVQLLQKAQLQWLYISRGREQHITLEMARKMGDLMVI